MKRAGFTLIELLVVMAIIAILVGLLIPAVQKIRESAARASCINNMRQINIALQGYIHQVNRIPPANTKAPNHGTLILLMPYLEQETVFRGYDYKKNWYENPQTILSAQPKIFLCPSNPSKDLRVSGTFGGIALSDMGIADYCVFSEVVTGSPSAYSLGNFAPQTYTSTTKIALMTNQDQTRLDDVKDGMSNTFSFLEDAGRPKHYLTNRNTTTRKISGAAWADEATWMDLHGYTPDGTTSGGPCMMNCTNDNEIYSFHTSGAVFGFADGAVKFIPQSVHGRIIAALTTRAGGEVVNTDF